MKTQEYTKIFITKYKSLLTAYIYYYAYAIEYVLSLQIPFMNLYRFKLITVLSEILQHRFCCVQLI